MLKLAPSEDSPPKENLRPGQEVRQSKAVAGSGADSTALPDAIMGQLRLAAANLEGTRQRMASSVLGPSHNLPTRTLAQQVGRSMLATASVLLQAQVCVRLDFVNKREPSVVVCSGSLAALSLSLLPPGRNRDGKGQASAGQPVAAATAGQR